MCAGADKVSVVESLGLGAGTEGEHVEEVVRQAQNGALAEVELGFPGVRCVDDLIGNQGREGEAGAGLDGGENGAAGFGDERGPVVLGLAVLEEVADGDEGDDGVAVGRGGGWVDAGGDVDVLLRGRRLDMMTEEENEGGTYEAGIVRQSLPLKNGVKGLLVLLRQKDVVRLQLGRLARQAPVK